MTSESGQRHPLAFLGAFYAAILIIGLGLGPGPVQASENDHERAANVILDQASTWRIWRAYASQVFRQEDGSLEDARRGIAATPQPPSNWFVDDFDDSHWGQEAGPLHLGRFGEGHGYGESRNLSRILLRGRFYLSDPGAANALSIAMRFRGGARIWVNGEELTRAYLPDGELDDDEPAVDYPSAAWRADDGSAIGPINEWGNEEQHRENIDQRIRRLDAVEIPAAMLRQGVNVIAIELRRTAIPHDLPRYAGGRDGWGTLGLIDLQLLGAQGDQVYGPHRQHPPLWNADPLEEVGESIFAGNPFEDLAPLRLVAPRAGHASAQVVITSGAAAISAEVSQLRSDEAVIPASALRIRYATRSLPLLHEDSPYYDALMDSPHGQDELQPLWLTVQVPADTPAGEYRGSLEVNIDGDTHTVPVRLSVATWQLPEPESWTSWGAFWHSPHNIAHIYEVEAWSAEHRRLLAPALRMLGEVGNDILVINAIRNTLQADDDCILVFRREGDDIVPDFTFVDTYLEDYQQYAGQPRRVALYAWENSHRDRSSMPILLRKSDGSLEPITVPRPGSDGSREIWQPVISGLRQRLDALNWQDTELLIGVGHDGRPSQQEIDFFAEHLTDARWFVFSHWRGDPPAADGQRILAGDLRVGTGETPFLRRSFTADSSPLQGGWNHQRKDYHLLTSLRSNITNYAPLQQFRSGPDVSVAGGEAGFTRIGFDYWSMGRSGQIWNWRGWNNLYRDNPRAIIAPGPEGPVATVRYEMLREGRQETEARIAIERALRDDERRAALGPELIEEMEDLLRQRLTWRYAGNTWHPGPNWQERSLRLYELAGRVQP